MSDSELNSLRRRLEQHERTVSRRRASMHNRIDFVRSGGGFGNPEAEGQLEDLQRREQEITEERRQLHEQIDALRAEWKTRTRTQRRLDVSSLPRRATSSPHRRLGIHRTRTVRQLFRRRRGGHVNSRAAGTGFAMPSTLPERRKTRLCLTCALQGPYMNGLDAASRLGEAE